MMRSNKSGLIGLITGAISATTENIKVAGLPELLLVQGIQQKVATGGTEPKSTTIGVAYVHPLSRRTNVYATYGQTRNNTTGNFALRAADETIAPNAVGNDPKAFSVGVRHTF